MRGASRPLIQRGSRSAGFRVFVATVVSLWGAVAAGHHSVIGVYDDQQRFMVEVEVRQFELIDPHPLVFVEITGIPAGQEPAGISVGQTWTLEMDNARELRALDFHSDTFIPGDRLVVAVDPSRHSRYRENTLYLRGVEHARQGFIYLHNVRQLFPMASVEDDLANYLHRIR